MINVLIVEDSATVRQYLKRILESEGDIRVIDMAGNGEEAVKLMQEQKPDLITMDIEMPVMNGLDATRKIMEIAPVPIVIVTASFDRSDVEKSFLAMKAGAVAILEKPAGEGHPDHESTSKELVRTVRIMSEVKVVKRWSSARMTSLKSGNGAFKAHSSDKIPASILEGWNSQDKSIRMVAIGASTGGPPVIQTILSELPGKYPLPILIVQHIAKGFLEGMIEWLRRTTPLAISIASDGELIQPGHVYFAPDDHHLGVTAGERIALSKAEPENGTRPSVSHLFRSVMNLHGANAVGVLLTGMGRDGSDELMLMKEKGSLTIAQDKESSVVFGMPGEAVKLGAASYVLPPVKIASILSTLGKRNK